MSLLREGSVNNDGCVFRQGFRLRREIQDQAGVLVGCSVGLGGPGIRPTAASSRVTYDNTRALLINANKMTIRTKFRAGSNNAAIAWGLVGKTPDALNENQFFSRLATNLRPALYVANAFNDFGQYQTANASLLVNTDYVVHFVYDGTLAAASRVAIYVNGLVVASTMTGTIPATMRAGIHPVTIFNLAGGALNAPATDFVMYDCGLWAKAFSAAECLDDALDRTFA